MPRRRPPTSTLVVSLSILAGLSAVIAFTGWYYLLRRVPLRYADPVEEYEHGTIGVEENQPFPYWIWVALPRVFPEHLPGAGGYLSLGITWEEGSELPVGFSKMTIGYPSVGLNCALCHTATYRSAPGDRQVVVPGGPASTVDIQGYQRFLFACAEDPRFTPDVILPEIEYLTPLSFVERELYRRLLIPQTRDMLRAQRAQFTWTDENPDWGPGRIDPFNPIKFGFLHRPLDRTIGNADMMPNWNLSSRDGHELHWDGLNDSVREVVVSSALGDGASRTTLDPVALGRLEQWLRALAPPRFPFPVDAARAASGKAVYTAHCARCHEPGQAKTGTVMALANSASEENDDRIATDPHRAHMWDQPSADTYNHYTSGYDWRLSHFKAPGGYVAVTLEAIWLRGPYLHNGSVPTLWHLLHPSARPAAFYRGYDVLETRHVGFVWTVAEERRHRFFSYDTTLPGNANGGHLYGADLPEEQKEDLIEYLKTL
jgi:hypothetical protein